MQIRPFSVVLMALWLAGCAGQQTGPQSLGPREITPRLAIVGDAAAVKQEWVLQLSDRLSTDKPFNLVPPERTRLISSDQSLAKVIDDPAERRRLGWLLPAQYVAVLTMDKTRVHLLLTDTRVGVTLVDAYIAAPTRGDAVALLGDKIEQTLKQFPVGVTQVFAIPEFDQSDGVFACRYLQSDLANAIRLAANRRTGTAITSAEEAKSLESSPPIYIRGNSRTETFADGSWGVDCNILVTTGDSKIESHVGKSTPFAQAIQDTFRFFSAFPAFWRMPTTAPSVSDWFARADEAEKLGDYRRTVSLREIAVQLQPDNDAARIALIKQYTDHTRTPHEYVYEPTKPTLIETDPSGLKPIDAIANDWLRALAHCDYLVRNKRLNREEATRLCEGAAMSITGIRGDNSPPVLVDCDKVRKDFLRNTFAKVPLLAPAPPEERAKMTGALDAYQFIFDVALLRTEGNFYNSDDLDLLADLVTDRLPEPMEPSYKFLSFLKSSAMQHHPSPKKDAFSDAQYKAFLNRLVQSDRPLAKVYGRYGLFCIERYANKQNTPQSLAEAEAVVAMAEKAGIDQDKYSYFMDQLRFEVKSTRSVIEANKPRPEPPPPPPIGRVGTTTGPSTNPTTRRTRPPIAKALVTFEPIKLSLKASARPEKELARDMRWPSIDGDGVLKHFRPMAPGVDAWWGSGCVLLVHDADATEIFADNTFQITDVASDGQFIFVSCGFDHGIEVFDLAGKRLKRITKTAGLPECALPGAWLQPLGPGKLLATGFNGREVHGWIALIDFDGKEAKVEVILDANRVRKPNDGVKPDDPDPTIGFAPRVVVLHTTADTPAKQLVYVVPQGNPRVVDVATRKVTLFPRGKTMAEQFPRFVGPSEAFLSANDMLYVAGNMGDFRSYKVDTTTGALSPVRQPKEWTSREDFGSLARQGDWVYYAGMSMWRRINVKTNEEDVLITPGNPMPGIGTSQPLKVAISTQYGLVGYSPAGELFRVKLDETLGK